MANPFVGTWKSTWLSYDNDVVGSATLTVTESLLSQPTGQFLHGMWDGPNMQPGTLYGKISGDTWEGDWALGGVPGGKFNFKLQAGGSSFEGTYNTPNRLPPRRTAPHDPFWNGTLIRNHQDVS